MEELRSELVRLQETSAQDCETTLLIHPWALNDFLQFNDFLQICDDTVVALDLEGEIQVASFHPQYQFAGTRPDDVENNTNRAPFPTLHLLREASIERVLQDLEDPDSIFQNNIMRLRELGVEGWQALWKEPDA